MESSANSLVLDVTQIGRSLMNNRKREGQAWCLEGHRLWKALSPMLHRLRWLAVFSLIRMTWSIHASDPWFHSGWASLWVSNAGRDQRPWRRWGSQGPSALLFPLYRRYVWLYNRVDHLSKSCNVPDDSRRCWWLYAPGVNNRGLLVKQVSNLMPWICLPFWRLAKTYLISSILVVLKVLWSSGIG